MEKRKTINGEDVLFAMNALGFDNYVEPLKIYLKKYREIVLSPVSIAIFLFIKKLLLYKITLIILTYVIFRILLKMVINIGFLLFQKSITQHVIKAICRCIYIGNNLTCIDSF